MFTHYRFVDCATQGYVAFTGGLALWGALVVHPFWWLVALAHVLVVFGVHRVIVSCGDGAGRSPWLRFLRHLYPVLLYTAVYGETGHLSQVLAAGYRDPLLIRLEEFLIGGHPSLDWMAMWPWPLLSEVLHAAYFSFYVMVGGMALLLYAQDLDHSDHFVCVTSVVFYVCYVVFVFFPTAGPGLFFGEFNGYRLPPGMIPAAAVPVSDAIADGFFYKLVQLVFRYFETPGAAFPSSHVAAAWCTVWFSFLYLPRLAWWHAAAAILLSVATIYCRFHYAVDGAAGRAAAAVLDPLGDRLYRKYPRRGGCDRRSPR